MSKIAIILFLLIPLMGVSQQTNEIISKKQQRENRPSFIEISTAYSQSNFRDFATSPLSYGGSAIYLSLSKSKIDQKIESEFGFDYSSGNYSSDYNEHSHTSSVKITSVFYSRLYNIKALNTEKLNVKAGGLFHTSANLRINYGLQNNALGIEIAPSLLASVKLTRDISREKAYEKKFLFIKFKRPERKRNLAFQLNVGVLNSSYRNGFVYADQSSILNDMKVLGDYQFSIGGFRMSSALDYKIFLKNKNAVMLSYIWDAYKTGGDYDVYEMAQHTLKFTFLFNTNNR